MTDRREQELLDKITKLKKEKAALLARETLIKWAFYKR